MAAISIEDVTSELVTVRFVGKPGDAEFAEYLLRYQDVLRHAVKLGKRYAVVYVTEPNAKLLSHRHARRQADWMAEHEGTLRDYCAAVAFVLPSPIMRGVLRMILKLQPVPTEYQVFEGEKEARRWAQDQLAAAGG